MMNPIVNLLLNQFLQQHPEIQNNPRAMDIVQTIQSGDAAKGQQMAQNFCNSYGNTPEEAINMASNFFHLR